VQREQVSREDQIRRDLNSLLDWKKEWDGKSRSWDLAVSWAQKRQNEEDRARRWVDWIIRAIIVAIAGAAAYHYFK
jgi:hypothetical protein